MSDFNSSRVIASIGANDGACGILRRIVTVVAWLVILASAVLSLVSAAALLMLLAGGYGTASTTLSGFIAVVVLPPVSLLAGIAFLRRRPWARYVLIGVFSVILAVSVSDYWRANPEPYRYVSPGGVPTTVLATDRSMFVPPIAVSLGMLAILLSRRVRREFARNVPSATVSAARATTSGPDEARGRRVGRIGHPRAGGVPAVIPAGGIGSRSGSRLAAWAAAALLLAIAAGMAWLVYDGIETGTTILPSKSAVARRPVPRADEPVMFWVAIACYASVAAGCVGLASLAITSTAARKSSYPR